MRTRRGRLESLALAILLSVGAGVVWGVLAGWTMAIINEVFAPRGVSQQLVFLHDGTPLIRSYDSRVYQDAAFSTLDGKPVKLSRKERERPVYGEYFLPGPAYLQKGFRGLGWDDRIAWVDVDWYDAEVWYFIHDGKFDGHGYLVGYDMKTKRKIGYIGRDGFRSDEPSLDKQFAVNGQKMSRFSGTSMINQYYQGRYYTDSSPRSAKFLLADDGLASINLDKRSVKWLRKESDLICGSRAAVPGAAPPESAADAEPPMKPVILLRTPDEIVVLAPDGKQIRTCRLPAEARDVDLRWVALSGGKALVNTSYSGRDAGRQVIFWFDADGKVVQRKQFDLHSPPQSEVLRVVSPSAIVPSPGSIAAFVFCYPWAPAEAREPLTYSAALGRALANVWPMLLVTAAIGVALACVVYRRQRQSGLWWTWAWTIFVLLFGLPAYFGYLAHRTWPARLPCLHCGRRVPRDRPACFACGREFPAPPAKGTEVFA